MTTNHLISDAELHNLSGYTQGAAQARFLKSAYGLIVPRRKDGRVRVTWDAINQAVSSGKNSQTAQSGPKFTK